MKFGSCKHGQRGSNFLCWVVLLSTCAKQTCSTFKDRIGEITKCYNFLFLIIVLCAHGGFNFDFKILINNMRKHQIPLDQLRIAGVHFADTFEFCKEVSFFVFDVFKTLINGLYFWGSFEIVSLVLFGIFEFANIIAKIFCF